jgi:hypothetical protein
MDEVRRVKQNAILTMIGDYAVIYQLLHQVPWRCLSFVNESNSLGYQFTHGLNRDRSVYCLLDLNNIKVICKRQ